MPDYSEIARRYWQVEPVQTITVAVGGPDHHWRCPDARCGEDVLYLLIPHPKDPEREPNRCPTCLATAAPLNQPGPAEPDTRKEPS